MAEIQSLLKRSEYLKAEDLLSTYLFKLSTTKEEKEPIISFDYLVILFECLRFVPRKDKPAKRMSLTESYLSLRAKAQGHPSKESDKEGSKIVIDFECTEGGCKQSLELPIEYSKCECFKYVTKTLDPETNITLIEPFLPDPVDEIKKFMYLTLGALINIMFDEIWTKEVYSCNSITDMLYGLITATEDVTNVMWCYVDELGEAAVKDLLASDTDEVRVPPLTAIDIQKLREHKEFSENLIRRYAINKHKLHGYEPLFEGEEEEEEEEEQEKSFVSTVKKMISPMGKKSVGKGTKQEASTSKGKTSTVQRKQSLPASSEAASTPKGKLGSKGRLSLVKEEPSTSKGKDVSTKGKKVSPKGKTTTPQGKTSTPKEKASTQKGKSSKGRK